jgi:UDP-N-acetylglucosamine:LPS N-acetylglucosamine transferase
LAEANAAQLPVVVYDYVPGQERGNVEFVRHNGIGEVAIHSTAEVVRAVQRLVNNPQRMATMRHNQELVAPKRSSRRIAALIASMANTRTIPGDNEYVPMREAVSI